MTYVKRTQMVDSNTQGVRPVQMSREGEECDDAKRQTLRYILYLKIRPMASACLTVDEVITKPCRCDGNIEHAIEHLSYVLLGPITGRDLGLCQLQQPLLGCRELPGPRALGRLDICSGSRSALSRDKRPRRQRLFSRVWLSVGCRENGRSPRRQI